jgi:hypothetical protein
MDAMWNHDDSRLEAMAEDQKLSDAPIGQQISFALEHHLRVCGLFYLKGLFEVRGVKTVQSLRDVDMKERIILLGRAKKLYEVLGLASSSLESAFDRLCMNQGEKAFAISTNSLTMEPAVASDESIPFTNDTMTGGSLSIQSLQNDRGPTQGSIDQGTHVLAADLPRACETDCKPKQALAKALREATEVVPIDRCLQAVQCLNDSNDLAVAAAENAARALGAITVRKSEIPGRGSEYVDNKKKLKAAKLAVRDVILPRACSVSLGVDSKPGVFYAVQQAVENTGCDDNAAAQMMQAHRRVFMDRRAVEQAPSAEKAMKVTPETSATPLPPGLDTPPPGSLVCTEPMKQQFHPAETVTEMSKDIAVEAFKLFALTAFRELADARNKQLEKSAQWLSQIMGVSHEFVFKGIQRAVLHERMALLKRANLLAMSDLPETDSDDDDERCLQALEARLDRENGADAANEQTFGEENAETTWTFEDALAANDRLAASNEQGSAGPTDGHITHIVPLPDCCITARECHAKVDVQERADTKATLQSTFAHGCDNQSYSTPARWDHLVPMGACWQ